MSADFVAHMEDVLDLYAEPYNPERPVVCFDETSTQMLADARPPIPAAPGHPRREDYEYRREGTRNLFLACEPLAGWRHVEVTQRRTKEDFAHQMRWLVSDQMRRYVRWWREGYMSSTGRCFDIGGTTARALSKFVDTGEPYSGPTDAMSAGNGSLMRLSPVPMCFVGDPAGAIARSADSSRTTHGSEEAVDACRYFVGLLVGALRGVGKEELLSPLYCPIEGYWERNPLSPKISAIAEGSFKHRDLPEIRGTGYVVDTLEAVLWAFHHTGDFRKGALRVVNLGEDADTTGAVYGQIAGACYGVEDIPPEWQRRLAMGAEIESLADSLFERGSRFMAQ